MSKWLRVDRRAFERAFNQGAAVAVNKDHGQRFTIPEDSSGWTRATMPDLLANVDGDGPSRPGEYMSYYVAIQGASA